MDSASHQLCPSYSGNLIPTDPTAIRLWETFTFTFLIFIKYGQTTSLICRLSVRQVFEI